MVYSARLAHFVREVFDSSQVRTELSELVLPSAFLLHRGLGFRVLVTFRRCLYYGGGANCN